MNTHIVTPEEARKSVESKAQRWGDSIADYIYCINKSLLAYGCAELIISGTDESFILAQVKEIRYAFESAGWDVHAYKQSGYKYIIVKSKE